MNWFYIVNNKKEGPITPAELKELIREGIIKRGTLVWKNGMDSWCNAEDALNIFPPSKTTNKNTKKKYLINFFASHWKGNLSISISVWAMACVACVFITIEVLCFSLLVDYFNRQYIAVAYWANTLFFSLLLFIWYLKGSIHSVLKNSARDEKTLRSISLIFLVGISFIFSFNFYKNLTTNFIESYQDAFSNLYAKWEIKVINDGYDIVLRGGVGDGISNDFIKSLKANKNIKIVHLNLNVGGYLEEAEGIADNIQKYNLDTYISTECVSACTSIFIKGKNRYMKENAKLGFHRAHMPGFDAYNYLNEDFKNTYAEAGISPDFIEKIFNTPHTEMWYPSGDELLRANVIDKIVSGDAFAKSELVIENSMITEDIFLDIPLYAAIKVKEPETYKKIIDEVKHALLDNKSEEYVRELGYKNIQPLRDKHLPYSDDDTLIAFFKLVLKQMKIISKTNKDLCFDYSFTGDTKSMHQAVALLPKDTIEDEIDLLSKVLISSDFTIDLPDEKVGNLIIEKVVDKTIDELGEKSGILSDLGAANINKSLACDALITLFENVLELPKKEAVVYIRFSYAPS